MALWHLLRVASALLLAMLGFGQLAVHGSEGSGLVVHEWGTFTSIAGENGQAVEWRPLDASSDLPCFVERFGTPKGSIAARVRMETPVLYFYAPRAMTVDVSVRFKQGLITEWFPHASVTPTIASADWTGFGRPTSSSNAAWHGVTVQPNAPAAFLDDHRESHYYVARRTDAAPLAVGSTSEKFLFYRGIAEFEPPISALVRDNGRVEISSTAALGDVIFFENHGGSISYRSVHSSSTHATFDPPVLDGESATPQAELEKVLIAHGLYPAEAKAMVETWRDSWFEDGSRLFYVVPRGTIDDVLPIDISPAPQSLVRVFVGRVELDRAHRRSSIQQAAARVCR